MNQAIYQAALEGLQHQHSTVMAQIAEVRALLGQGGGGRGGMSAEGRRRVSDGVKRYWAEWRKHKRNRRSR